MSLKIALQTIEAKEAATAVEVCNEKFASMVRAAARGLFIADIQTRFARYPFLRTLATGIRESEASYIRDTKTGPYESGTLLVITALTELAETQAMRCFVPQFRPRDPESISLKRELHTTTHDEIQVASRMTSDQFSDRTNLQRAADYAFYNPMVAAVGRVATDIWDAREPDLIEVGAGFALRTVIEVAESRDAAH